MSKEQTTKAGERTQSELSKNLRDLIELAQGAKQLVDARDNDPTLSRAQSDVVSYINDLDWTMGQIHQSLSLPSYNPNL